MAFHGRIMFLRLSCNVGNVCIKKAWGATPTVRNAVIHASESQSIFCGIWKLKLGTQDEEPNTVTPKLIYAHETRSGGVYYKPYGFN